MSVSLSIIIVSYNVRYFLEQCLHTVRRAAAGIDTAVIVVDNHSSDGSIPYLKPLFPEVHFIAASRNLGFAKACNLGYRHAGGSHVLFLNPDVLLGEETLRTALQFLVAHPDAGAVGVRMIDGSGRFLRESKRAFPAPLTSLFKLCGLARLAPRSPLFSRYYLGHLDEHQNHSVAVLAGAFMMLPRIVLEKTGPFDEAFFMYGEDIDLSYRIKKAGFANYYLAGTSILHFKGESTRKASVQYVQLFYNAMSIFVRKYYKGVYAGIFQVLLQCGIWMHALLALCVRALSQLQPVRRQGNTELPVAVFADKEQYRHITRQLALQGRSAIALKTLREAAVLAEEQELVLCLSRQSMSAYLSWMQQQQLSLQYRFHIPGSGGIIGSSQASRNGQVFIFDNARIGTPDWSQSC